MDAVTGALKAVAAQLDGWQLTPPGGNFVAASVGPVDGLTPPAAVVSARAVRWANVERAKAATLDAEVMVALPGLSLAVAGELANAALSAFKGRLDMGGRTLGGAVVGWRLMDAITTTSQAGAKTLPAVLFTLELWLDI